MQIAMPSQDVSTLKLIEPSSMGPVLIQHFATGEMSASVSPCAAPIAVACCTMQHVHLALQR